MFCVEGVICCKLSFLWLNLQLDSMTNQTPFIFLTKLVKDMLEKIDVYDYIINNQCSEYTLFIMYIFSLIESY